MSVLTRHWLESQPHEHAVVLDAAAADEMATRYFAPVASRLSVVVADVTRPESWREELGRHDITHIVHGATITPVSRVSEPELENPGRIVDVNLMGTVALLDWARALPRLRRFVYVSSGAVYKHHGPDRPGEPLPEDGYVMPRTLYGISKLASELITERYGELFGLSTTSVRLASVYGTLDRPTASRNYRHVPNRVAHMAVSGVKRVGVNSLEGVGDYVHVEDVARAIVALLLLDRVRYCVYNIATGHTTRLGELVAWAAEKCPGFHADVTAAQEADIVQDPTRVDGMWGAYDISRISAEAGWRPRPVREAFQAYMEWIACQ